MAAYQCRQYKVMLIVSEPQHSLYRVFEDPNHCLCSTNSCVRERYVQKDWPTAAALPSGL